MDAREEIMEQVKGLDRGIFSVGERVAGSCTLMRMLVWLAWWITPALCLFLLLFSYFGVAYLIAYVRMYTFAGYHWLAVFYVVLYNLFFWNILINFLLAVWKDPGSVTKENGPEETKRASTAVSLHSDDSLLAAEIEREARDLELDMEMEDRRAAGLATSADGLSRRASSSDTLPMAGEIETERHEEPSLEKGYFAAGGVRQGLVSCRRCAVPRPPRAHHCRHCKKCVLKMDHHCPLLNNCVGFMNYKNFILTCFYAGVGCIIGGTLGLFQFALIGYDSGHPLVDKISMFGSLFACLWGISIFPLLGFHLWLTSRNLTTLEALGKLLTDALALNGDVFASEYDLGIKENFLQVFGDDPRLWLLPVHSAKGDGWTYPVNVANLAEPIPQV